MIETEGLRNTGILMSDFRKTIEANIPLGRIGQPDDLTGALIFLASDDSKWMTGECLVISGGMMPF